MPLTPAECRHFISADACGPCRAFTPRLEQFYESAGRAGRKFQLVMINQDESQADMAAYLREEPDEFERSGSGVHIDGSQVSFKFLSLSNYIAHAYRVKNYAISGPEWIASERFDITAKLPANAPRKQLPEML